MFRNHKFNLLLVVLFLLTACTPQTPTANPTTLPTTPIGSILTATAAANLPPTATVPAQPTTALPPTALPPIETTAPGATSTTPAANPGLPDISAQIYLDDRSTPAALMLSYFNAINKHSYVQAYSYYADFTNLGTLDEFTNGYSETQSVSVVIGNISNEGAAGSIYYTVPMVLNAVTTANVHQKFAACYILRLPQPGNYGAPPITPMHIVRGTAQSVPLTSTDAANLAIACPQPDYPTNPNASPAAVESLADVSSANYIDNRSDAVALMSSYVNAINRMEYVRAYSYWQTPPAGTFDSFAAGFTGTASVTVRFGTVTPDAGAGQIYYSLPVALTTTRTDGSTQLSVGCALMHLAQPGFQGTVPFQPLGITSFAPVAADASADVNSLLATACQ